MIGDLAAVMQFIKVELKDYDFTILELKGEFESLVHYIENIPTEACLYYNNNFERCERSTATYKEILIFGTQRDYSLSVMFSSVEDNVIRAIAACLYTGGSGDSRAFICLRRRE